MKIVAYVLLTISTVILTGFAGLLVIVWDELNRKGQAVVASVFLIMAGFFGFLAWTLLLRG